MGSTTVQHDLRAKGVVLRDSTVVEDDGAGVGGYAAWVAEADQSPTIEVDGVTEVKKILVVERPEASAAVLYVRPGKASVLFNGQKVDTSRSDKFFRLPVEWVRRGRNEVIVRGNSNAPTTLKIATNKHLLENSPAGWNSPGRSFRSIDQGRSWETLDGELTVRLHLTQYQSEGSIISPVLDLVQNTNEVPDFCRVQVQSLALEARAGIPAGTLIELAIRSGSSPAHEMEQWTDWRPINSPAVADHRYVQWRATLKSTNALVTPVLQETILSAKLQRQPLPGWAQGISVKEVLNPEIRHTAMPFEYEDPRHPKLRALREKYQLDDVVKQGRTELEKLVLLRDWVAHQWRYSAPKGHYPAWDAAEILEREDGMCVQYAITYIQCCAALGYTARYVCGYHPGTMRTAHEVTEVWSNEYSQWVVMDPTESRNEFYADPSTGRPLSMLETHDRMVKHYYGDKPATFENRPARGSESDQITTVFGVNTTPGKATARRRSRDGWPSWTKWLMLYYIPRNNFYEKANPLPRMQGWNQWDWNGFWAWGDGQIPRDWRYREYTTRRADVEWTLNQVRFGVEFGETPMSFRVQLATVTPHFDTFLASTDCGEWKPVKREFSWALHPGENRLDLRTRNVAGIVGPVSVLAVECPGN